MSDFENAIGKAINLISILSIGVVDKKIDAGVDWYTLNAYYPDLLYNTATVLIKKKDTVYGVVIAFSGSINIDVRKTYMLTTSVFQLNTEISEILDEVLNGKEVS